MSLHLPAHRTEIRSDVKQLIRQRRGDAPIQPCLSAIDTALVVIDMQTAFVDTSLPSGVKTALGIVPNINKIASSMRAQGGSVVWVYSTFDEASKTNWSAFFGGVYPDEFSTAVIDNLRDGSTGHKLHGGLDIHSDDRQFSKNRFSAFLPDACSLPDYLKKQGIKTVVLAGTLTNVCCESSARDAMMQNFNVIMISDANAARSDADHNASLTALLQTFADVLDTDTFIATLQPIDQLTAQSTSQPTTQSTTQPTAQSTTQPTAQSTTQPTSQPSNRRCEQPTDADVTVATAAAENARQF